MSRAALDAEYHDWQEHARAAGWAHGELCERWDADTWLSCQRPAGHTGDHASIVGMDPDVNDWVRWAA